jgi:hypothetical protein
MDLSRFFPPTERARDHQPAVKQQRLDSFFRSAPKVLPGAFALRPHGCADAACADAACAPAAPVPAKRSEPPARRFPCPECDKTFPHKNSVKKQRL